MLISENRGWKITSYFISKVVTISVSQPDRKKHCIRKDRISQHPTKSDSKSLMMYVPLKSISVKYNTGYLRNVINKFKDMSIIYQFNQGRQYGHLSIHGRKHVMKQYDNGKFLRKPVLKGFFLGSTDGSYGKWSNWKHFPQDGLRVEAADSHQHSVLCERLACTTGWEKENEKAQRWRKV